MAEPVPLLADVRRTALIALTTNILSVAEPLWTFVGKFAVFRTANAGTAWSSLILLFVMTGFILVFYATLYGNRRPLQIPEHLRRLSLVSAIACGILLAFRLVTWAGWFSRSEVTSVLVTRKPTWGLGDIFVLLSFASDIGVILLLIALSRQSEEDLSSEISVARSLTIAVKATVIMWGLWVGFNALKVVLTPYTYQLLQTYAPQLGGVAPSFARVLEDALRMFVSQACVFTAPYVVYKSLKRPANQFAEGLRSISSTTTT